MTTTHGLKTDDMNPGRQVFLVALDIDGTIVAPTTMDVSDPVRAAVGDVCAAGHHVVLASGRSLGGVLPIARELGLTGAWVVASNGAVIARLDPQSPGGYLVHSAETFDPAPVVRRARGGFPGVRVATEVVGRGYRVTRVFGPGELNGDQRITDVATATGRPTTRLVLSAPGIAGIQAELRALGVTVIPADDNWLDITPLGLSKATALNTVRARLGVHARDTIAVGDGLNDREMLAWAARGVAMAHAPAEVREAADEVTGTLQDDGAAAVLRSLLPEQVPVGR